MIVRHNGHMRPDLDIVSEKVNEIQPDLRIEIRPMKEYEKRQTGFTMPYGLIYSKEPTAAAEKFIYAVKRILSR